MKFAGALRQAQKGKMIVNADNIYCVLHFCDGVLCQLGSEDAGSPYELKITDIDDDWDVYDEEIHGY